MKKTLKYSYQIIIVLTITIFVFEVSYRFYVIDFYKLEFSSLNKNVGDISKNVDYLIIGDSFSTYPDNYVDLLRAKYPEKKIINLSIPGIGIKQVNSFVRSKIKKYNPKNIIYQVYTGNDLIDVKHLSNWKELSIPRSLYWKLTDYFMSGVYLNQRLKKYNPNIKTSYSDKSEFSPELYNQREVLLFKTNNEFLYKSIVLKDDFIDRYDTWKKEMNIFLNKMPKNSNVFVFFIPHCSQLNNYYLTNMEQLNGVFEDVDSFQKTDYQFYINAKQDLQSFENVTFLNPILYLRQKDQELNRLYFKNDSHLNASGQVEIFNFLDNSIFN
ncbi:hypothetical protein [Aquimarina sp. MMG016]|uniref:hypothetical protein n=1 Tax=Aquimarina sp. MMG016 TaxID=2822690 RepID=UPI001B3A4768|nr:hypothetical protein [Aquimarina sp. MMG016]MBQ4821788.1 hypothetical protein [Aquimarina sp. MMG016]